jgi:ubiquinone/menaquinone biosynthesis C-methylase UbiE
MVNDTALLQFYLELHSPEAQLWNLSPESLYIEFITRDYIRRNINVINGMKVCNIGIGTGEWDDFLGYWLNGKGSLTSVDIDADICEMFRYRQSREGHPNPSRVVCMDIFASTLPRNHFDLVTIIGSTVKETGEYEKTLESCFDILKKDGCLLYMDFASNHTEAEFERFIQDTSHQIEDLSVFDTYPQVRFFVSMARKQ